MFRPILLAVLAVLLAAPAAFADGILIPTPIPDIPRPIPFGIRYHHVDVAIREAVAQTSIDQVFTNRNARDLEATYIFPIPEQAAISRFAMWIDSQPQEATLRTAEEARRIYEDIVRRMQDPALLEYAGRNLFKARVYPVPAHGEKRIALNYSEVLARRGDAYEYVYPLNTEKFSSTNIASVRVTVVIESQRPLRTIYSPSHDIEVVRQGDNRATVSFEASDVRPNTDFRLYYTVGGEAIGATILSYRPDNHAGYFLMFIDPTRAEAEDVLPRDVVFVLDISGSMQGKKIEQARGALKAALQQLRDVDRFAIVTFASGVNVWRDELQEVGRARREALRYIDEITPRGGTNIAGAMARAAEFYPRAANGRAPLLVFITDGLPTVGETDAKKLLAGISRDLAERVRVFGFGVGFDVNTELLDGMADEHQGRTGYVKPEENLEERVSSFIAGLADPLLLDLKVRIPNAELFDVEPATMPDLYGGVPIVLAGRYRVPGSHSAQLTGTGTDGVTELTRELTLTAMDTTADFVARIWAQRRVGTLLAQVRRNGETAELKEEITGLAKEYGLVTPYTSYLVLEPQMERDLARQREERPAGFSLMNAPAATPAPARDMATGNGMSQRSGEGAVSTSTTIDEYRRSEAVNDGVRGNAMRLVGTRQFFYRSGVWVESGLDNPGDTPVVTVTLGSEEYFALARQAEVARIMALGSEVVFRHNGKVYRTAVTRP